jgi:hypothetical protein
MTLKARVRGGRLVVDEPTDLPEGTELELLPLDPGDWLDDTDRAARRRRRSAHDQTANLGFRSSRFHVSDGAISGHAIAGPFLAGR